MPYTVRNYTKDDLEECTDCYASGFFEKNSPGDRRFLKECMDALVGISNFMLVAESEGKIVGLLGAAYKRTFSKELSKSTDDPEKHKDFRAIMIKRLLGLYRLSKEFKVFFSQVMARPPKVADDCDCEIIVLCSRKEFRCGVGTALVNGMIERCKKNGVSRIRIATDTGFNYRFYEKFGTAVYEKEHAIDGIVGKAFVYEISL